MALKYYAQMTFGDGRRRKTARTFDVASAVGEAYLDAADAAARAATALGLLFARIAAHSDCTVFKSGVFKGDEFAPGYPTAGDVYFYDTLLISARAADGEPDTFTIPGRKKSAYNISPNGVDVLFGGTGTTATQDLVTSIEAALVDEDLSALTVEAITVNK